MGAAETVVIDLYERALGDVYGYLVRRCPSPAVAEDLTAETARSWWLEPAPAHAVVAELEGRVLGSAKMGPNRPGRGSHVATASFMADPAATGRGVGRALGEHMLTWAGGQGYRAVQFNAVVETNTAAVALWRSLGFTIVGTVPEAFDHSRHGLVGLHVMHRFL